MSNISDSVNTDVNDPPSELLSTSQPFRSKSSQNNKIQDNEIQIPIKAAQDRSSLLELNQSRDESLSIQTLTNTPVSDLATQCQNLNIDSGNVVPPLVDSSDVQKGKNSKKKDIRKQLKIMPPNHMINTPTPDTSALQQTMINFNSLHEFFLMQVSPMYAVSNSRYLENICHHPQFQLTHGILSESVRVFPNINQHAASVPNTPLLLPPERPNIHPASSPSSPAVQLEATTPGFLDNISQHPLLSQTFQRKYIHYPQWPGPSHLQSNVLQGNHVFANNLRDVNNGNGSPRKKKNKKKDNDNEDKRFDLYFSTKDVETGLKDNVLLEGVLRINPKQFQHSYVSSNDRSEQDILIDGLKNRNRALEGDVVVVQLIDSDGEESNEENKQKKGKVVYIKERVHNRTCIGVLKLMPDKNRQKALFVPRDHRIPRLNIPFTSWPDNFYQNASLYKDTLFLAKILEWSDTRFAVGKIICNIGQSGDMVSETKAILAQTDLDITPFGPEVRHLFPRLDYKIPDEEILLREDCRKMCVFSIDPFNCRDIDDAVSCKELDNGNYEIGVHIADVAHFLAENTPLDEKVADKATTIYLVERAYHMLPDELCMLCSLFPGVDKLTFSVFWEITKDGKVLSHRFSKTVINSCCQLAYEHAQAILDDDTKINFPEMYNGFVYEDVYKAIKVIGGIAAIFRKNRFENGALRIDQPKVSFRLSPTNGLPESFWIYESKESHQMIEEFMLLANMTVANRIQEDHPKLAFLRCHPPPSGYMLKQLAKSLTPMGIELDISSAGDLHRSLLPHVGPTSTDNGKVMVLNMLCAKPMTRAKYFCADGCDEDDFHHYALNVPLYTHFTSPIRRYADIMVHRLLSASLKYREMPKWEVDKVRMVAANCNKQKYNAKKAGELSTELYTLKYIEMHSPVETDAAVVEVREKYIDVIVVAMGLNRRIFFNNDFPGKYKCIKHDGGSRLSKMELTWESPNGLPEQKQIIEVFSILKVELIKGDDMVKVETRIVRPQQLSSS